MRIKMLLWLSERLGREERTSVEIWREQSRLKKNTREMHGGMAETLPFPYQLKYIELLKYKLYL